MLEYFTELQRCKFSNKSESVAQSRIFTRIIWKVSFPFLVSFLSQLRQVVEAKPVARKKHANIRYVNLYRLQKIHFCTLDHTITNHIKAYCYFHSTVFTVDKDDHSVTIANNHSNTLSPVLEMYFFWFLIGFLYLPLLSLFGLGFPIHKFFKWDFSTRNRWHKGFINSAVSCCDDTLINALHSWSKGRLM